MSLKLWLISQDGNDGYDTYDSAVVVAATAEDAREIDPGQSRLWRNGAWYFVYADGTRDRESSNWTWTDPESVKVELLGIAAPDRKAGEVVCASFNAG